MISVDKVAKPQHDTSPYIQATQGLWWDTLDEFNSFILSLKMEKIHHFPVLSLEFLSCMISEFTKVV